MMKHPPGVVRGQVPHDDGVAPPGDAPVVRHSNSGTSAHTAACAHHPSHPSSNIAPASWLLLHHTAHAAHAAPSTTASIVNYISSHGATTATCCNPPGS